MKVLFDKVAVSTVPVAEKIGRLYVPPSADEGQIGVGTVQAIGSTVTGVSIGNEIYFNKFTSSKIRHNDTEYYVVKEMDIIVVR